MKLTHLLGAGAAALLAAGVAHAQLGASATPNTGVAPNQAAPAPAEPGTTGLPSPDSSRPTGADAGRTNLPNGQLHSAPAATAPGPVATTAAPSAATATTTTTPSSAGAASATSAGANASFTNATVTNGPVPDTPENRRKYGGPMSRAGRHTKAAGN